MVRERTYCVDCRAFLVGDPNGTCRKHGWAISMKLAQLDKVCSYESFKDTFIGESAEFVEVLTPFGEHSFITLEGYEEGKEVKGGKLNFWHLPRKRSG